jgi:hypothetical protein
MNPNIPEMIAEFALVGVSTIAGLSAIGVGIHAYLRRVRRKDAQVLRGVDRVDDEDRLARIEQAVDAIAIEVERIAESQRFLTKLQTERTNDRVLKS